MGPGDQIGRFEVVRTLGEGGIATVYHVRHLHLDVPHALKLLHVSTKQMRDRLITEGKIQAKLRHRNIVHVSDVFEHEGQVGLVMDFVEGFSLAECLKEEGAMSQDDALALFRQILDGVRAAHDVGVTHRDLKPANILLTSEGTDVVAKITDFGIAKVMHVQSDDRTRAGTSMGTPGYMAPEQIRDSAKVDHRADIFALGAILYEMLSGRRAFKGHDALSTMNLTVAGSYTRLPDVVDRISPQVAGAVAKALEPKPEDRFASCRELEKALFGKSTPERAAQRRAEPEAPFVFEAPHIPPLGVSDEPTNPTIMPEPTERSPATVYFDSPEAPTRKSNGAEDAADEDTEPAGGPVSIPTLAAPAFQGRVDAANAGLTKDRTRTSLYGATRAPSRNAEPVSAEEATRADESRAGPPPTRVEGTPWAERKEEPARAERIGEKKKDSELNAFSEVPGTQTEDLPLRVMRKLMHMFEPLLYAFVTTAKYLGPMFVSFTLLAGWLGSTGRREIEAAQVHVDTALRSTTSVMDTTKEIVDEIAPMTTNPDRLRKLKEQYDSATDPKQKAKIGKELYLLLDSQLVAIPVPTDPAEEARRRELERKVKLVLDKQAQLDRAQKDLDAVGQTFGGTVARRLRMID
jgi:eukaryotic-like serine/threonine-protein kinase